jgi:exonuclease III
MLIDLTPPSKDTIWQTELKRKIQQSVVYMRPISLTETSTGLGPNGPPKQAGVAILILEKVDFKPTLIKRDKEGHSILIKGEIHQKEITIINLYAPNVRAPNFIRHILKDLRAYINSNTVVVGDFNSPLSPIDMSSKQKNQ